MRVATGKVIDGKVVVEGAAVVEAAAVTVLVREGDETFEVSPEQEAELLLAIGKADRGATITGDQIIRNRRDGSHEVSYLVPCA